MKRVRIMLSVVALLAIPAGSPAQGWSTVNMVPGVFLNDFCMLADAQHAWAVGASGAGGEVISLVLRTTDAGAHWNKLPFPGQSTASLGGVWFVSPDSGWVVGSGGAIYASADGGTTWSLQSSGTSRVLNKVHFTDSRRGWITGGRQDGSSYLVLKTTDGGTNWQDLSFGSDCYSCTGLWFADSLCGWVTGMDASINPFIQHTTDGGATWSRQTTNLPSGNGEVSAVHFVTPDIGWASTSSLYQSPFGSVLHTTDGGTTWYVQYATGLTYNYCIDCQDSLHVAIASSEVIPSSLERIFTSTDGGNNWQSSTPLINQYTFGIRYRGSDLWIASQNSAILHSPDNGASWAWQFQAPYWRSLAWSDSSSGWVVAGSNAGTDGYCWRTTDGGRNWAYSPTAPGGTQIQFADSLHGWILVEGSGGTIKRTTNGGASWSQFGIGGSAWIGGMLFASPESGWAFGGSGNVRFTSNGGTTWTSRNPGTSAYLEAGQFISPTEGWVAGGYGGGNGYIGHTTDAGANWTSQPPAQPNHFYACSFLNPRLGWIGAINGYIQGTTDGGATWQLISQVDHDFVNGILMLDSLRGWLVASNQGGSSSSGKGYIYHTSDGGTSWQLEWTAPWPNGSLSAVTLRAGKEPWACGTHSTILRGPGASGVADGPIPECEELSLTAAPAGHSGAVRLDYSIPQRSRVRLAVYDALGRCLATLVDGTTGAGPHCAVWDYRASAGTYFIHLQAGTSGAVRKVALVR